MPGESSIKISWDRVNSASGYDIEVDGVIKDIGNSTNYIHEALEPNTKHTYKVRAKKDDNYGEWSKVIAVATLPKKDTTDKDNNGATKGESTSQVVNKKVEKAVVKELKDSNTSEVVTQIATETTNAPIVVEVSTGAESEEITPASEMPTVEDNENPVVEDTILTLPLNINVESTNNTLLVHWDKVEGAKGYDIEVDGKVIVGSIDTFYESINLLSGTEHTYRVRVKDDTKIGEWSQVIAGTTLAEDIIVSSSITLTSDRTFASLNLTAGIINLNGFKLTVAGDLLQSGGTININKGKLTVKSNYKITGNSYLSMPDAACYALVEGNFEISSNNDGYNYLKAGTLEVKGNLTQKSLNYSTSSKCNFNQKYRF